MKAYVDQPYRDAGGLSLRFDFFREDSDRTVPLIVAVHGGGWISGDKEDYRDVALCFALAGFAVAVPQYRLAPLHPYPAAVEDLRAFVRFCRGQTEWNVSKVGAFGNSAGGHLAMMLGLSDAEEERVDAVVSVGGISDVTNPREHHLPIAWAFLDQFLPFSWEDDPEPFVGASPISHVRSGVGPFLLFHGTEDEIVPEDQSLRMASALLNAGVKAQLCTMSGEGHSLSTAAWNHVDQESKEFFWSVLG